MLTELIKHTKNIQYLIFPILYLPVSITCHMLGAQYTLGFLERNILQWINNNIYFVFQQSQCDSMYCIIVLLLSLCYNTIMTKPSLPCILPGVQCVPDEENILDVLFGVTTVEDCQLSCEYHSGDCAVFTWFDNREHTIPSSCFLYSR